MLLDQIQGVVFMLVLTVLTLMYLGESVLRTRGGAVVRRCASIHNSIAAVRFLRLVLSDGNGFPSAVMPGDFFVPTLPAPSLFHLPIAAHAGRKCQVYRPNHRRL